ncbi:hypothetical protein [Novosphingobium sp. CECT 9465]|uniref:hypothetical protein n=1 Tax=Novosphingobium sp. CECT 9465 TaxID=2829794 RepID=UPI001E3B77D5|nr:hypothetical protein [Novosphingobium sp. CECT 9465]CAH0496446.1 hypothetical protein NVSP9465_01480 [Novosphingobium sp. CECT 9465]
MSRDPEFSFQSFEEEDAYSWPDEEPFRFARGMMLALPLSGLLWIGVYCAWNAL